MFVVQFIFIILVFSALLFGLFRAVIAILLMEKRSHKVIASLGLILAIPLIIYLFMILIYVTGGGH
jgi:uncharacterized membrane protein